jgi:hypothetical protein
MAEPMKNLGDDVSVDVFVEDVKLNKDFKNKIKWEVDHEYYEGNDEHIGGKPVDPWQRYKISNFSFDFEEENASHVAQVIQAVDDAAAAGQKAKIVVVEKTNNTDGTVSKSTYTRCVMKFKKTVSGKGEKVMYSVTGRGQKKLK